MHIINVVFIIVGAVLVLWAIKIDRGARKMSLASYDRIDAHYRAAMLSVTGGMLALLGSVIGLLGRT